MLWDGEISGKVKKQHVKTEFLDCELPVLMIGKAGGCGYDKLSSAIASALSRGGISDLIKVEGGAGNQENAFKEAGFDWVSVI